ncbi:MAG: hypothetical protein R6W90_14600 [Ignavibacteriaceae bacterium]
MNKYSDKKNSLWLSIQFITSIVIAFINLKLNLLNFGENIFGIWVLFSSFWGVGSILDFGFGTGIVRFIAQLSVNDNKEEILRLIFTGLIIFIIGGTLILIAGNIVSNYLFFNNNNLIPSDYFKLAKKVFFLLGINFFIQYLFSFFRSILDGLNNFVLSSKMLIIHNILGFASVLTALTFNLDLFSLTIFYTISSASICCFTFIILLIKYRLFNFNISLFSLTYFKKVFKYSFSIQIASLTGAFIDPAIKYIIGNFGSLSSVTYFEIARRFTIAIAGLFNTTFKNYLPKVSILTSAADQREFLLKDASKLSKLGVTYSGFMFGICQVFLAAVIKFWFGYDEVILIFMITSLAEIVNAFGYSLYVFFMGIGKAGILAVIQVTNFIATITILIIGFKVFNNYLGLLGYFASVIFANFLMLFYLKKLLKISYTEFLSRANFNKLLYLIFLTMFTLIIVYLNIINVFACLTLLSIVSLFLFYKDLKNYSYLLLKLNEIAK